MPLNDSDFARQLGALGMTIRMRRLADKLVRDARRMYREMGLDIEPNWHAIMLMLADKPDLGVSDIARNLDMTHPSASAVVGQLIERDYLEAIDDPADGRRRIVRLTEKARREMPKLIEIWNAGGKAIDAVIESTGYDVLGTLTALEDAFGRSGYDERSREAMAGERV